MIINPENAPINNSAYYAFKTWSETPKPFYFKFQYPKGYKHRYIPKLKVDNNWSIIDSSDIFKKDSILGYTHLPGKYYVTLNDNYTFVTTHKKNSLRITHPIADDSNYIDKSKIWIMGCSFTHGWSINDEETFAWLVQEVYKDDYANLQAKLSFIQREFINLTIQDKKGTITSLLGEGAIAKVPVITFKRRKLILNLPFEVKRKAVSKQFKTSREKKRCIEIGVDLGLKHFAVLSVIDTTDKEKPIEIARYFIGSKQLFDMKFDLKSGKFVNRYNHRARNPRNVKLKLIHLRGNIKNIQRNKNGYENRCIERDQDFKKKLKFHKLSESLSILWERSHNINREIVRQLNYHIIAIACFHGASKIKMENLKFSKHSKKRERGNYLAFWQTHWLFGQIQEAVKLQAYLHHVNFERVNAAYTSQRCSECGLIEYKDVNGAYVYLKDDLSQKEQKERGFSRTHSRAGKQFTCHNVSLHRNQSLFRLDADLSAARNIALA